MLKHQKQGPAECLITSIAILMDMDREQLLDVVRSKVANKPWRYFNTREREISLDLIKQEFNDRYPSWLEIEPEVSADKLGDVDLHFVEYHVYRFRGAITIADRRLGAHIATYEYGMVVDSALGYPMPFYVWIQRYRQYGFKVHSLHCDYDSFKPEGGDLSNV